jgi:hypothetical protein
MVIPLLILPQHRPILIGSESGNDLVPPLKADQPNSNHQTAMSLNIYGPKNSPNGTYKYKFLSHSLIHLLDLNLVSSMSEEIKCIVVDTRLSLELEYEAVSYVWGEPLFSSKLSPQDGSC